MEISFTSSKLSKMANSQRELVKSLGKEMALKVQARLKDLSAAVTLADLSHLPPARCHELQHDYQGFLAVDLKHPHRLIFKPTETPPPRKPDGGLDRGKVSHITITEIADYH